MRSLDGARENITMEELEQSGKYSKQLLEQLKSGDIDAELDRLPEDDKNERAFMEPLLYFVKKERDTYKVYTHYGDVLKRDILRDNRELATNIIIKEPELIKGTPLSRDINLIMDNVISNPKIIRYMDDQLKTNTQVINKLENMNNPEITKEIVRIGLMAEILSNPELSNDKDYMSNAIRNDATMLEYASEELRNDGEFLRNEARENEDIISYVANNAEKFGLKGIEGVRESSTDYIISNQEYSEIIDNKAQEEHRYKNAKEKIQEHINNGNKGRATFTTAAVVSQSENISEEFVRRTLNYAVLTMETIKKDLTPEGEMKISLEDRKSRQLVTPVVLNRMVQKLEEQNINLDEQLKGKMEEYIGFYENYMTKVREQNRKIISLKDVQDKTKEADGVIKEFKVTREAIGIAKEVEGRGAK